MRLRSLQSNKTSNLSQYFVSKRVIIDSIPVTSVNFCSYESSHNLMAFIRCDIVKSTQYYYSIYYVYSFLYIMIIGIYDYCLLIRISICV